MLSRISSTDRKDCQPVRGGTVQVGFEGGKKKSVARLGVGGTPASSVAVRNEPMSE